MVEARFVLLGPMRATVDGAAVSVGGTGERALLAQLLLSPGRTVPTVTLVDRLWSESSLPADPVNALQLRVSKLRRGLAAAGLHGLVTRDGTGYRADVRPSDVDAVDFVDRVHRVRAEVAASGVERAEHLEQYDRALALWRGDPLTDFATEAWAVVEAGRLTELRLAAVTERAQVALALGRHHEVVEQLEPLAAADPVRESLTAPLMVALWRGGRQVDALAAFARTRDALRDELGLEPSTALRDLHGKVLRHDESLGPVVGLVPRPPVDAAPPLPTRTMGRARLWNLPTVGRSLIGRDALLDTVCALAGDAPLVTLVGPGGAGKTTLAVAAAQRLAAEYADGAAAVWLGPVERADRVVLAVADALGVPLDGAAAVTDVRRRVTDFLAPRRMLLVLDNCEHVVEAVATLVDDVLARSPEVTVVTTSREALAVTGEVQVAVGPLEAPPEDTAPGRVLEFPAAQLFVERARQARPGMVLRPADLDAVGRIARSLDGIPLALELAAARVGAMSTTEIAEGLNRRFTLLTSGSRTADARQRTLRATVDWSYRLLEDRERLVFDRLSVFHGSWTLGAAEAVVAADLLAPPEVTEVVSRLVERSMVVVEHGPVTRYRLLETLREYAAEQLAAAEATHETAGRHARYFRDLTARADRDLRGPGQRAALTLLRAEHRDVVAALTWLAGSGAVDAALEMAGDLGLFWHLGRHLEGRGLLRQLLAHDGGSATARARALQAVSLVERPRGCLVHPSPTCAEAARESLAALERAGDASRAALSRVLLAVEGVAGTASTDLEELLAPAEEQLARDGDAWGLAVVGFVRTEAALRTGDEGTAVRLGHATAAAFRDLDDHWGLSAVLYHLGGGLHLFGRYRDARAVLEEAATIASGAGLHNTAQWALADLGVTLLDLGDVNAAREAFDRARTSSNQVGDGAGAVLANLGHALVAQVHGQWSVAGRLFADAAEGFRGLGTPVPHAMAVAGMARCAEAAGDGDRARELHERVREVASVAGEAGLVAAALEGLARVARTQGHPDRAARLTEQATELRRERARPAPPHERVAAEPVAEPSRQGGLTPR